MIFRNPESAAGRRFDVVVIGGGILGACHALESAKRGLSVLLLEKDDFGGAASWASQRIIHGGLRYIQSLGFTRHRVSMDERRWFLKSFPALVHPLPCLMPLYNRGLKRTGALRTAMWINDALSGGRNNGLDPEHRIPDGRILSPEETLEWYPRAETSGLRGGALWHDGFMTCPQRVLMEILRWACSGGAQAINYVEVTRITRDSSSEFLVHGRDQLSQTDMVFRGTDVINSAGASTGHLHGEVRQAIPSLCMAFGLIVDRPAPAAAGIAVTPDQRGNPVLFLAPLQDKLLAGTCHLPWNGKSSRPGEQQIQSFLDDINRAAPHLRLTISDVLRVLSGLLPADAPNSATPASRAVLHMHPSSSASSRFISVWGVKYTTARALAARTLNALAPRANVTEFPQPAPVTGLDWTRWKSPAPEDRRPCREILLRIQREEAVMTLDDLLYRRTDWGMVPGTATAVGEEVRTLLQPQPEIPLGARL